MQAVNHSYIGGQDSTMKLGETLHVFEQCQHMSKQVTLSSREWPPTAKKRVQIDYAGMLF